MPNLSVEKLRAKRNKFRLDVAHFLAARAQAGALITYGELTEEFGGSDRGWGDVLGGIALRCYDKRLPMLSVIVVSKATGRPSEGALLYEDLGLQTPAEIDAEQRRCFAFDWRNSPLAPLPA